jgi:hypothetical protein
VDQPIGCPLEAVELTASVDHLGEFRFADGEAGGDGTDAAGLLLEIPDEFAAGLPNLDACSSHRNLCYVPNPNAALTGKRLYEYKPDSVRSVGAITATLPV